jgi:hypothetical protein
MIDMTTGKPKHSVVRYQSVRDLAKAKLFDVQKYDTIHMLAD